MFRVGSNLRKKVLSLYTRTCVCLINKASSTIAVNGYYFYLITTTGVFCVIEHMLWGAKGLIQEYSGRYKLGDYFCYKD